MRQVVVLASIAEEARVKAAKLAEAQAAAQAAHAKELADAAMQAERARAAKLKEEETAAAKRAAEAAAVVQDPECPICLEEVGKLTPGHCETKCSHHFHAQCLGKWLAHSQGSRCPLCTAEIEVVLTNRVPVRAERFAALYRHS